MDSSAGSKAMGMYLMRLNCTVKMIILCYIFSHNKGSESVLLSSNSAADSFCDTLGKSNNLFASVFLP